MVGFSRAGLAVILVTGSSLLLPPPSLPRGRPEATYGRSFPPNTSRFSPISQPGRARKFELEWEGLLGLGWHTGARELRRTVTRLEARTSQSATQPPKHLICKPVKDYGCQNEKCESLSVKVTQLRLILIQKNSRTYLAGDSGKLKKSHYKSKSCPQMKKRKQLRVCVFCLVSSNVRSTAAAAVCIWL